MMIQHLAAIMDGNRRWAKQNGLSYSLGYSDGGFGAAKRAAEFCLSKGIKYLSLYAFSLENFKRPQEEQDFLFSSMEKDGEKNIPFFQDAGIKVRFIGDRRLFPKNIVALAEKLEEETKQGEKLQVNVLFCYGARQELMCGIKELVHKVTSGVLKETDISEDSLEQCLWTQGIPHPELIIRTGGAQRLSNFLLYQAAYSEFYFLDCFWPDITEMHLQMALDSFYGVKRNFGV